MLHSAVKVRKDSEVNVQTEGESVGGGGEACNLREAHGFVLLTVVLPQGISNGGPEQVELTVRPWILRKKKSTCG